MINPENTIVLVIDIQEKLVAMLENDTVSQKAAKLMEAAAVLDIPVIVTEQYPKGLGKTVEVLKTDNVKIFEKTSFSAMRQPGFKELLAGYNRKNVVVCGIEGHVCVYQTVAELLEEEYHVEVLKDGVASRAKSEFNAGLEKMKGLGAQVTSLEIVLFELLKSSKHPHFKHIQSLIK